MAEALGTYMHRDNIQIDRVTDVDLVPRGLPVAPTVSTNCESSCGSPRSSFATRSETGNVAFEELVANAVSSAWVVLAKNQAGLRRAITPEFVRSEVAAFAMPTLSKP